MDTPVAETPQPRGLHCPNCGATVLPVDPGWPVREVATLLRVKPARVESLSAQLAATLDPPQYRRLSDHPRLHRVWSSRDVATMQQAIVRTIVKRFRDPTLLTARPDRPNGPE